MLLRSTRLVLCMSVANIAVPALAGTPYEVEMTCPVGGEEFTHTATGSLSTYGSRPDGKPYGSWIFPMPLAECPSNGLVIYRDFEETENERLAALVLSQEYRALKPEAPYYRAQWLSDRLDGDTANPPWLLMRAAWEVDDDPLRKARYQREFAERAGGFAADPADLDLLFLRFRVANAWRELEEFDRAAAALDSIPAEALDVDIPDEDDAEYEAIEEAEARRFLLDHVGKMRALILASNSHSEPLTLIPERMAILRCTELMDTSQGALDPYCLAPDRAEEIASMRKWMRAYDDEGESE